MKIEDFEEEIEEVQLFYGKTAFFWKTNVVEQLDDHI